MSDWFICSRLTQDKQVALRLFCFPYAGAGASIYRSWSSKLPSEIQVCSVQLPGRESRLTEAPFIWLAPLIQSLVRSIAPYLDLPFAFFGHSMGALISFELVRELRRQKKAQPDYLFVSGRRAPQLYTDRPQIHNQPQEILVKRLRRLKGTSKKVFEDPELMRLILPALRADYTICDTYIHKAEAPLHCPISAFGGLQDKRVSFDELEAWRDQTNNAFNIRMLTGGHFFIHRSCESLLRAIIEDLHRAELVIGGERNN